MYLIFKYKEFQHKEITHCLLIIKQDWNVKWPSNAKRLSRKSRLYGSVLIKKKYPLFAAKWEVGLKLIFWSSEWNGELKPLAQQNCYLLPAHLDRPSTASLSYRPSGSHPLLFQDEMTKTILWGGSSRRKSQYSSSKKSTLIFNGRLRQSSRRFILSDFRGGGGDLLEPWIRKHS